MRSRRAFLRALTACIAAPAVQPLAALLPKVAAASPAIGTGELQCYKLAVTVFVTDEILDDNKWVPLDPDVMHWYYDVIEQRGLSHLVKRHTRVVPQSDS